MNEFQEYGMSLISMSTNIAAFKATALVFNVILIYDDL